MKRLEHGATIGSYVLIALILGVITYVEFAIVEYEISWLSNLWIFIWLGVLSVAKFILVVAFFMHLKDDEFAYTGFFASGMLIAVGTFIVLVGALFTGPAVGFVTAESGQPAHTSVEPGSSTGAHEEAEGAPSEAAAEAHEEGVGDDAGHGAGVSDEVRNSIATDGNSRPLDQRLASPPPREQRAAAQLPQASEDAPPVGGPTAAAQAPAEQPAQAGEAAAGGFDAALGESTYANCAGCHQATGTGIPGVFPPLAEHMPQVYNVEGGRDYLIRVVLYGLQGPIEALGQTYSGAMPGFAQLSDEQVAAVLNHELTSWGNDGLTRDFQIYTPEEVAAQRGQGYSGSDVHQQRPALP